LKRTFLYHTKNILAKYATEHTHFDNSAKAEKVISVKRDKELFSYKSFSNNHLISIAGQNVWLHATNRLRIGDIVVQGQSHWDEILRELKKIATRLGIRKVVFQCSPDTPWDRFLATRYKAAKTFPIGYYLIDKSIDIDAIKFGDGDLDTF